MNSVLNFHNIHTRYGRKEILHGVDLDVRPGMITGIVGPNGCGKSTLVKTVFGIVPLADGRIDFQGKDIQLLSLKQRAGCIGYVGQEVNTVFDFTVEDVVGMALYNRRDKSVSSRTIISNALKELEIEDFAGRNIRTLSGGERKMVFLARTAAQGVNTVILDEPTNHLDIHHQLFLMNYLKKSGKTILIVIHDLRLASFFCDWLYLMKEGTIVSTGKPSDVLTSDNVSNVFEISGNYEQRLDGSGDFLINFRN